MNSWRWMLFVGLLVFSFGCSAARDEESAAAPPDDVTVGTGQSNDVFDEESLRQAADREPTTAGEAPPSGSLDSGFDAAPMSAVAAPVGSEGLSDAEPSGAGHQQLARQQVVQIFYATDRSPANMASNETSPFSQYLPVGIAAFATALAGLAAVFLPRKAITVPVTMLGLISTTMLGQSALVEAQRLNRAAEFSDRSYGSGRHEQGGKPVLELGICEVSIPPDHRVGQVESPSILRFEFREEPEKHVILNRVIRIAESEFYQSLGNSVARSSAKQAFVFVHGYNVGFDSAVKRTAQIAYDLKFDGAAICYSWPSHGGLARYTQDEANVAWTVTQLESFLQRLSLQSGASTIHLVAHSMGNRAMTQALERLALRGEAPRFGQVILAAPDVDTSEFRTRYAPALLQVAERVTLYASSNDRALLASTRVHGHTRAGLSGDHLFVIPGLETVDVSPIDTSLIGHSYYGDNPMMIRDLVAVIHRGLPADGREWLKRNLISTDGFYWAFRPELLSQRQDLLVAE